MAMNDIYLKASLFLLCLELFHFLHQRKLDDKRTIVFFTMIINTIMICLFSIILTYMLDHQMANHTLAKISYTIVYLTQLLFPYILFCTISLTIRPGFTRLMKICAVPIGIASFVVLINPFSGFISSPQNDGLLHVNSGYPMLVYFIMICYLFDLFYLISHFKVLKLRQITALGEVSLFLLIGVFAQNISHIKLFIGFAASLSVVAIHLTLHNPYAYVDFVTHLFNMDYFSYYIREHFYERKPLSLTVVEFPQLEYIHNIYKLGINSKLLDEITSTLWNLTSEHKVFRLNFNRFAFCSSSTDIQDILCDKLETAFEEVFFISGHKILCPAVIYEIHDIHTMSNIESLLSYIEFLAHKTQNIKHSFRINDTPALYEDFQKEQEIERFLFTAVEQNLFDVWYQPIYSIKEQKFTALEALSRLTHPKYGFISPELFSRLAIGNDLIFQIMPLQLHKICKFLKNHSCELNGIENVKINLTPEELIEPGYCEHLISIIKSYHLPTSRFQFEITETTATKYTQELTKCIKNLQAEGIEICLDDFGSSYANLNTILRLPFSVVKMDRSLLFKICEDPNASAFYQSMVHTLKNIGYKIVSEGIETEEEAMLMKEWGVDMIQGYYYSKPEPCDQLIKRLEQEESKQ